MVEIGRRAALVAVLLLLGGCGAEDVAESVAPAVPPPAVVVAVAMPQDVTPSIEFVGRTEAYREVDLRARVQGFLLERAFEEGQQVADGELLYVIDPAEFRAEVNAAQAEVERAEATHQAAINEVERARALIQRGNISEAELDKREAEAGRARADINAAKAELERAELDLGYTEIHSPLAGRIGRSAVDVGNLVGPESGVLATVVDLDPIYVSFPVSDRELLNYRRQAERPEFTPRLRLADGSLYPHDGRLEFLDNRIDPTTGTVQVRGVFANPDHLLLPGQFVTLELRLSAPRPRIVIPQSAVQQNQAGHFVLVVGDDNRVEARTIVVGDREGAGWVVEDGLEQGESVIVEGLQKVRPGGEVAPVAASAEG